MTDADAWRARMAADEERADVAIVTMNQRHAAIPVGSEAPRERNMREGTRYGWAHLSDDSECMEPAWCRLEHYRTPSLVGRAEIPGAGPVGSEVRCSCTVTGPEYDDTTFDPACPFHGENGTMVAQVAPKYCPVSEAPCEKGCRTVLYCKRSSAGDRYAEVLIRGQGTGHERVIPTDRPWRTGRKVGRTIYAVVGNEPSDDDGLIGMMDTPELAAAAVMAYNAIAAERVIPATNLRERLSTMNECVRIYVSMRDAGTPARDGWLEEEIAATDALFAVAEVIPTRSEAALIAKLREKIEESLQIRGPGRSDDFCEGKVLALRAVKGWLDEHEKGTTETDRGDSTDGSSVSDQSGAESEGEKGTGR